MNQILIESKIGHEKKSEEIAEDTNKLPLPGNSWKSNVLRWLVWYFQRDDNSGISEVCWIKVSISEVHPLHTDEDMNVPSKQIIELTDKECKTYTGTDIPLVYLYNSIHILDCTDMDSDTGSINIIGRLNEMDIRWTSNVRHRRESSATRRTSCCYDQSHFCNCQGATMSCDMHVTTWTAVTAATACDSTMCLALFGFFHRISRASKDHLQVPQHLEKHPPSISEISLTWPPGSASGCWTLYWNVMRTNENQWEPIKTN